MILSFFYTWMLILGLLLSALPISGQEKARFIHETDTRITIPFEMSQNLIIVPVTINGYGPLRFVLDTGISNTIITELTDSDTLSLSAAREVKITGLGNGESLQAFYSTGNVLQIFSLQDVSKGILAPDRDVFILMEDRFNLTSQLGMQVHGLIGLDMLRDHIVEFDFERKTLTFMNRDDRSFLRYVKKYEKIPLKIRNEKCYIKPTLAQPDGSNITPLMLIDTGASLAVWISAWTEAAVVIPEKTIPAQLGQGLSGEISGLNGRIPSLNLGSHTLKQPIISYPDSASVMVITMDDQRQGSLGNEIFRRFKMVLDFQDAALYIKPNKDFKEDFTYNRSGLAVEKPYPALPLFRVFSVYPGSPADSTGIREGDDILYLNYLPATSLSLDLINAILHGEAGHTVRFQVMRDGRKLAFRMRLPEML